MKKAYIKLYTLMSFLCAGSMYSQMSGTYSVPATYSTVAAAVNDLNLQGINGSVTILVAAGHTETVPVGGITMTVTGTAANTITFQKSGAGANPQLIAYTGGTATPASAIQDGVWSFIGSDYVTIDAIDISDPNTTNPATMEYGYGFFKSSTTDGCQNNVIKNCKITMRRANNALGSGPAADGSRAINFVNALRNAQTTNVTVASASGSNSNNQVISNTIENCNIGIAFMGFAAASPFTLADQNNHVGGAQLSLGNEIVNFGGGGTSSAAAGVRTINQYDFLVQNNIINSNNGSGAPHAQIIRGILVGASTSANASVIGNTVTIHGGGTTNLITAIENNSGSIAANNTITIVGNLITNCTYTTATSGGFYGIFNNATAANLSISSNSLINNSTNGTSGSYWTIYNSAAITQSNSIINNLISGTTFSASSTSLTNYNIYNLGFSSTATVSINNNTITNTSYVGATGGTGAWAGIYSTATTSLQNVQNNSFVNLSLKTTGTGYLIWQANSSTVANISNNQIVGAFTRTVTSGTGTFYGVYNSGFTTAGATANVFNNNFSNFSNGNATGSIYLIYWTAHNTLNIYNNIFDNYSAPSATGTFFGIYPYYYSTTTNVYDNTVSNVTHGTGAAYGLYFDGFSGTGSDFYNNTIFNIKNSGITNNGIYILNAGSAGAGSFNFHRNRISDLASSNVNASSISGINILGQNGGNVNVYNNLIANITATASSNAVGLSGINVSGTSAALNVFLSYNSILLSGTSTGSGFGSSGVFANTGSNLTLRNNIIVNNTTPTGLGIAAAFRRSSTTLSSYTGQSNRNLFYAGTPGPNNVIYTDGTNIHQTLSTFQTFVSPRDAASVTENPTFLSTSGTNSNFLNIDASVPNQIEGWAVPVGGITTDYTLTARNANTPDIGAWEGNYITSIPACSGTPGANSAVSSGTFVCLNTPFTVSLLNSYTVSGISYQWQSSTAGASGPYTSISGANGAAYTTSISVNTWFQAIISCGGSSVVSSPVQVNVNASNCECFSYCNSGATSTSDEELFNVSIGTLNNSSNCSQTGGPGSILNRYSNYAGIVAAPVLSPGNTYVLSVTAGQCGSTAYQGMVGVYMDLNQNGSFTDPGENIYTSPYGSIPVAGITFSANVTIPVGSTTGITRMRVVVVESSVVNPCGTFSFGETEDYCVQIANAVSCSGTPAANSAVASTSLACSNSTVNLSLSTTYTTGGLSYQWSTSTSSVGPWAAVSNGTLSTLAVPNFTTPTWFQAVITCTTGGASTTATPVFVGINNNQCECLAYCTSSATSTGDEELFNVSIGTLNNSSTCGQTGGPGSVLNQYSNYTGILAAPFLAAGSSYVLSVTAGQCGTGSYQGIVGVYMDFNQNGSFTDPGENVYTSPYGLIPVAGITFSSNVTIPVGATSGITRMRVVVVEASVVNPCGTFSWGETEDYCIQIGAPVGCSGAPAANSVVTTATNVCANSTVNLSLSTTYTTSGLSYQWSAATSSLGPWTAVSNGTLANLSVPNFTVPTWFQAVITCTAANASTTATPVFVDINNDPCVCAAYCASSATSTFDEDILNVSIGTLNNTSSCAQTGGPGSVLNQYSNYTGVLAAPNLTINSTYTLSVTAGQCNGGNYSGIVAAYIDFNQNGLFTDPGEAVFTSSYGVIPSTGITFTAPVTIPGSAIPGNARMRVIVVESTVINPCGTYSWGETEDYCVYLDPGPACTGANAGTLANATLGNCVNQTVSLLSNSVTIGQGTTYQWQFSTTPGGPYTNVSGGTGANSPAYTTGPLTAGVYYYVLQVACPSASLTSVSNEATVTIDPVPSAVMAANNGPMCEGQTLNLTGTATGATNYYWTGPASYTSNVQSPVIANVPASANGNYTLIAGTPNCSATAVTTSVTINSTALTINAPASICLGNSATLTAVGNYSTLLWSTGATGNSITMAPSTTTIITATGTGSSNCTANASHTLTVFNPTITGFGATVCTPTTVGTLSVSAFGPVSWYATSTPSNPIGTGNTFTATAVNTTTYYAQAVTTSTAQLLTTLAAGNGFSGTMFDVTAVGNIEVNGFDMHFSSTGTASVEVWYRPGTFVGFETSNAGWTLVHTTTATALGTGVLSPVPGSFTVNVPAGQTYGFYVTAASTGPQVNYTNGSVLGNVFVQNADVQIKEGKGGGYFTVTNSPRVFNGQMRYTKPGCTSPIIPVVMNVGSLTNVTASAFSSTICEGGSTALSASGAITYTWSNNQTGNIIGVSPTVTTTYSVTGEDNGCTGTATVQVNVNSLPSVSLTAASSSACVNGSTVALLGSPAGGVYTGANVDPTGYFIPASSGTFSPSYNVTDANTGCSNSATVSIAVNTAPSVSLTASSTTVCAGGPTVSLVGSPLGGIYSGTNVNADVFTPGSSSGTFTPVYTYTDAVTGCDASASVSIIVSACTDVKTMSSVLSGLAVYPNPSFGNIVVELANGFNKSIEITDLTGRVMLSTSSSDDKVSIDLNNFANGTYFVRIVSETTVQTVKVVKQ
jgi:hypothetical protein